jgi:ubiquinone/menaquinone biosynthesis C-methylase UbiE
MASVEPIGYSSFKEMEWKGWQQRAQHYHDRLGQLTAQASGDILDAVYARSGMYLLDICCGTGHACAEAAARGLTTVGIDFAPAMVDEALARFPKLDFRVGDAEALDFPDENFDVAVCAFGLLHLPNAERGLAEAHRVTKPGGAYAFSVWCTPDKAQLFGLLMDAVTAHSDTMCALPPGPSFFQFSDPAISLAALERAGFRNVTLRELRLVYEGSSIDEFLDWFEKSTVRVSVLYRLQRAEARARIRDAIASAASAYVTEGKLRIPCSAMLFAGRKPAS